MRILHVSEATLAGVGRHVLDLVHAQTAAGHEIHVAYADRRMDDIFRAEMAGLGGARWHRVDLVARPGVADLAAVSAVRRIIAASGPFDIVHGHSSKGGAVARLAAGRGDGLRVYTPNALKTLDPAASLFARSMYGGAESVLGRFRTDLFIAVSSHERRHALRLGIPADRITVVNNGTDVRSEVSRTDQRAAFALAKDDVCALFVGRLDNQKAPLKLIDAMARLGAECPPHLKVVMVGDGPLRRDCEEAVARAGLADRVRLVGRQRGVDAMQAADIFVLPSNYEGFPYVLIEALQCGLPIVTTDVGGARDMVEDGVTGTVLAVGDTPAIGAALARLAGDEAFRRAAAEATRFRARRFSASAMATATEAAYRDALAARGGAAVLAGEKVR